MYKQTKDEIYEIECAVALMYTAAFGTEKPPLGEQVYLICNCLQG